MFMGPCIIRYRGGIYDQQDATNSQSLLLEMLYMFRAIIAHHQELGTVCAAVRCISYEILSSVGYIPEIQRTSQLIHRAAAHTVSSS
jgi:hypothetical protein